MKSICKRSTFASTILVLWLATLQGCYLGRQLETPVTVRIESNFTTEDHTTIEAPRYIGNATLETYKQACIARLESSLGTGNVTVLNSTDTRTPNYIIVVEELILTEGTKTETVEDADSEFNGQTYELSTCDASGSARLLNADRSEIDSWTVTADKAEKVKNNRTLGQLISGTNQDNNTYREKLLSDNVFEDLSGKIGNRISAKLTSKMHKLH